MKKLIIENLDDETIHSLETLAEADGKTVEEEASQIIKETIKSKSFTMKIQAFSSPPCWKEKFVPVAVNGNLTTDGIIIDDRYGE